MLIFANWCMCKIKMTGINHNSSIPSTRLKLIASSSIKDVNSNFIKYNVKPRWGSHSATCKARLLFSAYLHWLLFFFHCYFYYWQDYYFFPDTCPIPSINIGVTTWFGITVSQQLSTQVKSHDCQYDWCNYEIQVWPVIRCSDDVILITVDVLCWWEDFWIAQRYCFTIVLA